MNALRIPRIVFFSLLVPSLAWSQSGNESQIPTLIKGLGSANIKVRETAHRSLMDRPDAAPALREALRSPDAEVARRAAVILDHLDRAPLRELDSAINEGRIERAIELATQLPEGKYEYEIMRSIFGLARKINTAYRKSPRGEKDKADFMELLETLEYFPMKGNLVSEATKAANNRLYFVRAEKVDINHDRIPPEKQGNRFAFSGSVIVSAGAVRLGFMPGVAIVFARADVEIPGGVGNCLIVSGGNVKIKTSAGQSLIIAKGSVELDRASGNRIISGKSVTCEERYRRESAITENDRNPLGFIRWSDAPKEKAAPKAK